ncbi:MAG: DinB family protein [Gemmatimonadales bacterium]|jgi:hypothetical protein
MRAFAYALAAALCAVPALATAQGMAGMSAGPASPVSDALRGAEQRYAQNITAALEEFPAEKYRYRPTGTQMAVGEIAAHLVNDGNYMLCSRVSGQAEPQYALVDVNSSKEALIAALRRSFEFCAASFASLNDAQMADSVPGFGPRMVTRANMALITVGDWADHYSQLAIYLRLNNMLPPTARRGM